MAGGVLTTDAVCQGLRDAPCLRLHISDVATSLVEDGI